MKSKRIRQILIIRTASKILKVVAINAFIIAYRETLSLTQGPQKCNYYIELMKGWNFTFKEVEGKQFNYSGSSYAKLANNEIISILNLIKGEVESL